jgi:chemotaxis-related protein WspB
MLFLLFQLGRDRYALQANHVVEVVPLLELKELPQAPVGVAGLFNYRGRLVPAVDLSLLTVGMAARRAWSTRIVVVNYAGPDGRTHLMGLIAEEVTEMLRTEARNFVEHGLKLRAAPYLGPVFLDPDGPIQWFDEQRLLTAPFTNFLFQGPQLAEAANVSI